MIQNVFFDKVIVLSVQRLVQVSIISVIIKHIPNIDSSPKSCCPLVMTSPSTVSVCGYLVCAVCPLAFATADCIDSS